jgi:heptosyltransferase II
MEAMTDHERRALRRGGPEYNPAQMISTSPALLIRLPNHVGDVVLSLPALELLSQSGYELHVLGKPWIQDLLSPYLKQNWKLHSYPRKFIQRVTLLREIRRTLRGRLPLGGLPDAIVLPNSFSSAFEMRLASWKASGYAIDSRSWLLAQRLVASQTDAEYQRFYSVARAALGNSGASSERAPSPRYPVPEQLRDAARIRLVSLLPRGAPLEQLVILCPFAAGTLHGRSKEWSHFPALATQLVEAGRTVVLCPGSPQELGRAQAEYDECTILAGVGLAEYAALLSLAGLVVANDTGPGHLAAAVGANLLSVRGPDSSAKYMPQGARVRAVCVQHDWPTLEMVRLMC